MGDKFVVKERERGIRSEGKEMKVSSWKRNARKDEKFRKIQATSYVFEGLWRRSADSVGWERVPDFNDTTSEEVFPGVGFGKMD